MVHSLVRLLKYPNIEPRDHLIEAIKSLPGAKAIEPSGDIWDVIEWLKTQPDVDLTTPPPHKLEGRTIYM